MQPNSEKLEVYLRGVVSGMVLYPDAVEITKQSDEMGILYTIKVHDEDRGKIMGKKGATAKALRIILRAAGFRMDVRAALKLDIPRAVI